MEEKILIEGRIVDFKKISRKILIGAAALMLVLAVIICVRNISSDMEDYDRQKYLYCQHDDAFRKEVTYFEGKYFYNGQPYWDSIDAYSAARLAAVLANHKTGLSYAMCGFSEVIIICVSLFTVAIAVLALVLGITRMAISKISITVTNRRVYGKTFLGKQVDLPVDSISAISSSMMKGIAVATSSGRIIFKFISNRDEVRKVIVDLINSRQLDKQIAPQITSQSSSVDELKKFKELLDSGVITQEEFDAKKKQLLGL